ncbi:MAG: hypothetical protein EPN34_03270 [Burkholderiaceae bacterium]|nr:MAG: hypothetical protein EPN34_03270 [Burkholderiaceae bacterium]
MSARSRIRRSATHGGLARAWGNHLVDLSDVGHLNPAPGFGEWPAAERLAAKLVVE